MLFMGVISVFSLDEVNSGLSIESIKSIFSTLIAPKLIPDQLVWRLVFPSPSSLF